MKAAQYWNLKSMRCPWIRSLQCTSTMQNQTDTVSCIILFVFRSLDTRQLKPLLPQNCKTNICKLKSNPFVWLIVIPRLNCNPRNIFLRKCQHNKVRACLKIYFHAPFSCRGQENDRCPCFRSQCSCIAQMNVQRQQQTKGWSDKQVNCKMQNTEKVWMGCEDCHPHDNFKTIGESINMVAGNFQKSSEEGLELKINTSNKKLQLQTGPNPMETLGT